MLEQIAVWCVYVFGAMLAIAGAVAMLWPIMVLGGKVFHWLPKGQYYAWREQGDGSNIKIYGLGVRVGNGMFGYIRHEVAPGKPARKEAQDAE